MTTVHLKSKSIAIVTHPVVNKLYVVDILVSEFITPFYSKLVYLFHICHCGHSLLNYRYIRFPW